MQVPSYVFLRRETGTYFFRWAIPIDLRPLLNGRKEIRRSLRTDNRRLAIKSARRLATVLEHAKLVVMAKATKNPPAFQLILTGIAQAVDGSLSIDRIEMDPSKPEEESKLLENALSTLKHAGTPAVPEESSGASDYRELVDAYLTEKAAGQLRHAKSTKLPIVCLARL